MSKSSVFARGDAWAGLAGLFSMGLAFAVRVAIGRVYSVYEARQLLQSLVEGGFFLVSTITTASATVLALMLTVLGFVRRSDANFGPAWFGQIRWISIVASVTFAGSVLTLLLMSVPLAEADGIPRSWNKALYHTVSASVAILSGLTISLVVMLLTAVLGIIARVSPDASVSEDQETSAPSPS